MPGYTTKSEEQYQVKWSTPQTAQFIKLRQDHACMFTGAKYSAAVAWGTILEQMGLHSKITPMQAKKKWDNLKRKYKDCKSSESSEGVSGKSTATTWPYFALMDEVLGQMHSSNPSAVIVSIPEDTPGPSSAVDEEKEKEPTTPEKKRKRDKEDLLMEFVKEEIRYQREADERRAQESRERMNRLFGLLEKLAEK
ncbi:hypothetical protein E1301_Tti005059 [Triplophysa tibetana]|uniref:Myb/SANT-like DNA-binding domain-containing protein n=1 Tax=Triplophysa tibetana TaxID=1572043 RepID=A0A5A9NSG3_9TELE|nr:hypothetical protein E1301_Tti005059 [Triplophysa tibetana]